MEISIRISEFDSACRKVLDYADCIPYSGLKPPFKTASGGEAPAAELWRLWNSPSLPLLPGPLWLRQVVFVTVISMSQKDLYENHFY